MLRIKTSTSTNKLKSSFLDMAPNIAGAVTIAKEVVKVFQKVKAVMDDCVKAYIENEKSHTKVKSVLKATGADAWTSSEQLRQLAKEQSSATGKNITEIESMQAVLLGFRSITGSV